MQGPHRRWKTLPGKVQQRRGCPHPWMNISGLLRVSLKPGAPVPPPSLLDCLCPVSRPVYSSSGLVSNPEHLGRSPHAVLMLKHEAAFPSGRSWNLS